ncbi:winged helix-turn-helix transcriptional regulator [Candidatus Woesearchaeota archaeon]|nr:winged helix-turn-helix transcriptional regulator [Candidatus Woesearchaeota archaeon]
MAQKVTLVKIRRIPQENVNQELQWVGNSLGLFNLRDRDSSCFRVFITLVRTARRNDSLSSDEIAEKLHLSRGTVIHHLTRLMESGIVVREQKGYVLRESNLQKLITDIRRDMDEVFSELQNVAKDIDERLG